jgi:hypothetical protein
MLVKFNSSTSGQIMMFSPAARQLLEILHKDCTARGVITSEQLPEAIERLRRAVAGGGSSGSLPPQAGTPPPKTTTATTSKGPTVRQSDWLSAPSR